MSDFSAVTELPGSPATNGQRRRLVQRYEWAAEHVGGARVLEVACGAGLGLGYLQRRARFVVGGDFTESSLMLGRRHYRDRVPLLRLDAQRLPFRAESFDAVILFEALYYLPQPALFFSETYRVLSPGGLLMVSSVNPRWDGFSPSAHSTQYLALSDIRQALVHAGFRKPEGFGGFAEGAGALSATVVRLLRRTAANLHVIPRTLAARALLKRAFYGRTEPLAAEVTPDTAAFEPVAPISGDDAGAEYQIIYAIASK